MTTRPSHQRQDDQAGEVADSTAILALVENLGRVARDLEDDDCPFAATVVREAAAALRPRPSVEEIARAILDRGYSVRFTQDDAQHAARAVAALLDAPPCNSTDVVGRTFTLGARVRKTKGSSWQGHVVGFYSTKLTPEGVCVESEREPGSVQIYPAHALEHVAPETPVERDGGAS